MSPTQPEKKTKMLQTMWQLFTCSNVAMSHLTGFTIHSSS